MELSKLKNTLSISVNNYIEKRRFNSAIINDISLLEFYQIITKKQLDPVFFLSTGRTGTSFFTHLLNKSKLVKAFHAPESFFLNPKSELAFQSKMLYEFYQKSGINNKEYNYLASQIYLSNREDLLFNCYRHNKTYIETSNKVSFFAPALQQLFPKAKFVFLHRHPGEFIRSGVRRKWYNRDDTSEVGRIQPIANDLKIWKNYDSIQKISWLWKETNGFIYSFLQTLEPQQYRTLNFSNLTSEKIENILEFIGIDDISFERIKKEISIPRNTQNKGSFPEYKNWSTTDVDKVKAICANLSDTLGHSL